MYAHAFKLDSKLYYLPEEVSGLLEFIENNADIKIEPFLQGKNQHFS